MTNDQFENPALWARVWVAAAVPPPESAARAGVERRAASGRNRPGLETPFTPEGGKRDEYL